MSRRSGLSTVAHVKGHTHSSRRLTCGALEAGIPRQSCGPCRGMQRAVRLVTLSEVSCRACFHWWCLRVRQCSEGAAADLWCPGGRCSLSALYPLHRLGTLLCVALRTQCSNTARYCELHTQVRCWHNCPRQAHVHVMSDAHSHKPTEHLSAKHLEHEQDLVCNNISFPV